MTWKDAERKAAARLGMARQPSQGVAAPDIVDKYKKYNGDVSVEHKERHSWPAWLEEAFNQAKANNHKVNLVYLTFTKGRGHKSRTFLCVEVTDMEDWRVCETVHGIREAQYFPNASQGHTAVQE